MEINNLIHILGWTLVNSIWQAIIIVMLLGILLLLIKPKYSKIRSMLAYASLLLVFALSIRTFTQIKSVYSPVSNTVPKLNINETSDLVFLIESQTKNADSEIPADFISKEIIMRIAEFIQNNLNIIVWLWFIGVLLLSLRMLGGYLYLNKIRTRNLLPVEDRWISIVRKISNKLRIKQKIEIFESSLIKLPIVFGYLKPVILLPIGMLNGMPANQVEMILAHELTHIKRNDYLLNIIQSFIEVLYFFNPAVWIISRIIREERECACDNYALEILGKENSTVLAKALITIQEIGVKMPTAALSATGPKNSTFRRIKRMLHINELEKNKSKFGISIILVFSLILVSIFACSTSNDSMNFNNNPSKAGVVNLNNDQMMASKSENEDIHHPGTVLKDSKKLEHPKKVEKITLVQDDGKFNFHKDNVHWEGKVENGKVVELYKNGERIPDNKIVEYEGFILDTLHEIDEAMADFDVDMNELKINLSQLKKDLKDLKVDIDFEGIAQSFNSEEFRSEMAELKKTLKEMKLEFNDEWRKELKEKIQNNVLNEIEYFNTEEFKEEMRQLKEELKNIEDIKIDVDFDKEAFQKSMNELKENMKNLKVELSDLDIDLSGLKVELGKLKDFVSYVKNDLTNHGYISDSDKDFNFTLNENEAVFEGEKLPNDLHKKYLGKYEEIFGHQLDEEFRIRD